MVYLCVYESSIPAKGNSSGFYYLIMHITSVLSIIFTIYSDIIYRLYANRIMDIFYIWYERYMVRAHTHKQIYTEY